MRVSETSTVSSAEDPRDRRVAKKALKVAEQFEQIGRRRLAPRTVRESLAELYRDIYGETLPVATVRKFVADWLQTKNRKYLLERLHFTKRASPSFSSFGHCCRPGSCLNNPDYRFGVQESHREKKFSGDYQRGFQAIKMICRAAKRDDYIAEDPAEFVETVRKSSEQARRPFRTSEIQRVISVATLNGKA